MLPKKAQRIALGAGTIGGIFARQPTQSRSRRNSCPIPNHRLRESLSARLGNYSGEAAIANMPRRGEGLRQPHSGRHPACPAKISYEEICWRSRTIAGYPLASAELPSNMPTDPW